MVRTWWSAVVVVTLGCGNASTGHDTDAAAGDAESDSGPHGTSDGSSGAMDPVAAGCGNGRVEGDEECDLGFANRNDGACTSACTLARCGDGWVAADEGCDPGPEATETSECTAQCTIRSDVAVAVTFDGPAHGHDTAVAIAARPGGGAVAVVDFVGRTQDHVLVAIDAAGEESWRVALASESLSALTRTQIEVDPRTGTTFVAFERTAGWDKLVDLTAVDADGATSWSHSWMPTRDPTTAQTGLGGLALVGGLPVLALTTGQYPWTAQTRILSVSLEGAVTEDGPLDTELHRFVPAPDGAFYGVGPPTGLVRISDGQVQWEVDAGSVNDPDIAVLDDGTVALLTAGNSTEVDHTVQVFDVEGSSRLTVDVPLLAAAIAPRPTGGFVVTGELEALPGQLSTNTRVGLLAYDAEGTLVSTQSFDGPAAGADLGLDVNVAAASEIWVAGAVSVGFQGTDAWLGRFGEGAP